MFHGACHVVNVSCRCGDLCSRLIFFFPIILSSIFQGYLLKRGREGGGGGVKEKISCFKITSMGHAFPTAGRAFVEAPLVGPV